MVLPLVQLAHCEAGALGHGLRAKKGGSLQQRLLGTPERSLLVRWRWTAAAYTRTSLLLLGLLGSETDRCGIRW